jgi:arylsulfatase A-like enzyme
MDLHWPYHLEEDLVHPSDIARAWQDLAIMYDRSNFNGNESIMTAQREHFIALYTRSLQYLDRQIGRLLSHVEKLGFAASTIVIAVSDHGEEFLDHGRWGHWESNLYEEILRVPLIIRLPGTAGGQVIRRQVSLLDTMPTILDLCGSTGAEGLLGTSLTPLWTERETEYNVGVVISEMQRDPWHRISVRTEHFKYIWDSNHPDEPHLYDLEADPLEKENVCAQHPHEAARLQAHVDTHLRRVAQTKPETALVQTEIDEDVARRLRDLGYVD